MLTTCFHFYKKSWMSWNNINWYKRGRTSLNIHQQINKQVWWGRLENPRKLTSKSKLFASIVLKTLVSKMVEYKSKGHKASKPKNFGTFLSCVVMMVLYYGERYFSCVCTAITHWFTFVKWKNETKKTYNLFPLNCCINERQIHWSKCTICPGQMINILHMTFLSSVS